MKTTKEEAIKNAYGENWDKVKAHIDEMGWIDISIANRLSLEFTCALDKELYSPMTGIFRPKSLRGIETNNGWIYCSDYGLPNEDGDYFIEDRYGRIKSFEFRKNDQDYMEIWRNQILCYRPITKPLKRIY